MKDDLLYQVSKLSGKVLLVGIISLFVLGFNTLNAQVSFTQTTDEDFNEGVLNNVVVSGGNVSLQNKATDVGTWLTTTVLPQTLSGHKTVTWNDNYVFLVGGYNGLTYSSSVYKATIQSGGITSWTTLNSLPVALKDPAVVVGTNTIYVMGGRDGSQVYNTIYYASINTDGTIGTWQTSAVTLPGNRWGHTAVYLNGYIYVAGGASVLTETSAINTFSFCKVLADNTLSAFSAGASLLTSRNKHSMVTYNSRLYILGGYSNGGTKGNTVYVATPENANGTPGSWSTETALPLALSNHSTVVTNGLLIVMAGENNSTLSNTVYYADADAVTLTWNTSPNVMYDYTKDGAAFQGDGLVFHAGGENLSGDPIHNTRYASLAPTANYVLHGVFVSNPFFELGDERLIDSLLFNATYNGLYADCQVSYRTAPSSGIWGNWTALTASSPIIVGLTRQYLQYKVILSGQTTYNSVFHDLSLYTPGTELSGNLNAITTFTQALSPYWATADISFTAGTHTFQAGTEILFLPETGLTVGQANVICNGNVTDSVKFKYYATGTGEWDGIYFDPNSDNTVSSQFYYTVIEGAGYGSNNANLYCNQSNEPLLSHCSLRNANSHGIRLNSAHVNLDNTSLRGNSESGAYLENSNPTFINCTMSYNGTAGVHMTSPASVPTYSSSTINNNLYGLYYPSPNFTFHEPDGSPTVTANTYNGIAIEGGHVDLSRTWNSISYDYIMLGNLVVGDGGTNCRLTIEPGNTVKFVPGSKLQVGTYIPYTHYGGELYAIGVVDSLITFTSYNGSVGGWEGIYFTDYSDWYGGNSVMDYCVVEKGNDYNMYFYSTTQAQVMNSTIRNAVLDGVKFYSSYGSFESCDFYGFGRYPIYFENWIASPTLTNNTYSGKGINLIGYAGGHITSSRTLQNDGIDYHILNSITVGKAGTTCRLTVEPGLTLNFDPLTQLQVGTYIPYNHYGGELNADGKFDSLITFKAYNNTPGGWEGIFFDDRSDAYGATSFLDYCIVEQGNEYNLYCNTTSQPTIDNSIFRNAVDYGIKEVNSSPQIHNSQFLNNGSYPVYYTDWTCNSHLSGNTYTGNTPNKFALSGGHYTDSRTLYNDGVEYLVLSDITIGKAGSTCRLTIEPGNTLRFASGTQLQVGIYIPYTHYGGELYAEGSSGNIITFMPDSETPGDWEGIFFDDRSDAYGATSSLKYCAVEKGNVYDIFCQSTTQPTMQECMITGSADDGLKLENASIAIQNSSFVANTDNGILIEGTSQPTIGNTTAYTCNFYDNGGYAVYQNGTNDIDARYNYWGTGDSAMIANVIYDKSDDASKGRVYFTPFAQVVSLTTTNTLMSGTVIYTGVGAYPIKNASMVIKNFGGTTITSTSTNTSGVYAFSSFPSGNYQMFITPAALWGGVNSTDALRILNHFAHIITMGGMKLAASDVNLSQTVNASDALYVMKRYTGSISSFPAGDWLYHNSNLVVNGNNVTNDLKMLCFGDNNASYAPAKKESSVVLVYKGIIPVTSYTEFDLPVKIKNGAQVGAISLGFYYPEEYLEINGAEFSNGNSELIFHAEDGLFRMAWCDLNPISYGNDDVVVTLKMKTKNVEGISGNIALELFEYCEFADGSAIAIGGVTLEIPEIQTPIGIMDQLSSKYLTVYPNPFNYKTTIGFTLKEESKVNLTLYNQVGTLVNTITEANYSSGNHEIEMTADNLRPGIYLLNIEITSNGQTYSKVIKVVVFN